MPVLPIREFPETVLRRKAASVTTFDEALQRLINDMIQTMYAAPGIGLAAPQIGVPLQVFVVDITGGREAQGLLTFINPEMLSAEGRVQEDEGCLSLPGVYGPTPRAAHVVLRGLNRDGSVIEHEGEGLLARAFQHEMDHLQGILFFNRMGSMARDLVMRKFKRAQRQRH